MKHHIFCNELSSYLRADGTCRCDLMFEKYGDGSPAKIIAEHFPNVTIRKPPWAGEVILEYEQDSD
jgi:hypothetical protein